MGELPRNIAEQWGSERAARERLGYAEELLCAAGQRVACGSGWGVRAVVVALVLWVEEAVLEGWNKIGEFPVA